MCQGPKGMQASRVTGPKGAPVQGDNERYRQARVAAAGMPIVMPRGAAAGMPFVAAPAARPAHAANGSPTGSGSTTSRRPAGDRSPASASSPAYPAGFPYYAPVYLVNNARPAPYYDVTQRPGAVPMYQYPMVRAARVTF